MHYFVSQPDSVGPTPRSRTMGQRAYSFAILTHIAKLLFTEVVPICGPASNVDACLILQSPKFLKLCQSITWKWYLNLVLIYTIPIVSKVECLFNGIHFRSYTKRCFIRPHAIIHHLASFFTVVLP